MNAAAKNVLIQSAEPEDRISDWYLPESGYKKGFIYPGPVPIEEHPRLFDMANALLQQARERTKDYDEFVIRYGTRTYRGHRIETIEGSVYALRRLPDVIPELASLGIDDNVRSLLLHPWLRRGGLVLVCGETGQGKSTTCAATVKERMIRHGSFCLTVEDPPEMPLHGVHGKGRCLQTEVKSGNFAEAMKGAMRCYPTVRGSMLYVGETRDPETAVEVLRVATNGHLVLTTLHAEGLIEAIKRFGGMAGANMPESEVRSIFATSFRMAIHQQLEDARAQPGRAARKKLKMQFLVSESNSSVAHRIRRGETESLSSDIDLQRRTLANHGVDELFKSLR